MCLDRVDKVYKNPLKKEIRAWKGFDPTWPDNELLFSMFRLNGNRRVPRGQWIKAQGRTIQHLGGTYPAGFHIVTNSRVARRFADRAVQILARKIVAVGKQCGSKCYIAKEIYVPKPGERLPR